MIKEKTRQINIWFDYIKIPGRENPYGYFEYEDLTEEELSQVGEFRKLAKEHLEYSIKHGDRIPDMHKISEREHFKSFYPKIPRPPTKLEREGAFLYIKRD